MDIKALRPYLPRWQNSFRLNLAAVLSCLLVISFHAAKAWPVPADAPTSYPSWWFARGVIQPTNSNNSSPTWNHGDGTGGYPKADDYSTANIGQLKAIATQAAAELNAHLPGGAGDTVNNLVASWGSAPQAGVVRDDYATLNLGQLKAVAQAFYDQLIAAQYTGAYPWANGMADDYSVANLGQLKYLFSFDVTYDSDGDGIPDWWEIAAGFTPGDPSFASSFVANPDLTINGVPMTYFQAYEAGIAPQTAASNPSNPRSPSTPVNALQNLQTTSYVAIDLSSNTNIAVGNVSMDQNGTVGFSGTNFDAASYQSFSWSNGQLGFVQGVPLASQEVTISDGLQLAAYPGEAPSVNSYGQMGYYISYQDYDFCTLYVNQLPYGQDYFGEFQGFGSGTYLRSTYGGIVFGTIFMGNSIQSGITEDYVFLFENGAPQWIHSTIQNPAQNLLSDWAMSPSGRWAGSYTLGSENRWGVGTWQSYTDIGNLRPVDTSDNEYVIGWDPNAANPLDNPTAPPVDALFVYDGAATYRLSALLQYMPVSYSGTIVFPAYGEAWIDSNGDVVASAMCLDTSSTQNTRTWVPKLVLWTNIFQDDTRPASTISFLNFSNFDNLSSLIQFNANALFVGNNNFGAQLLAPVEQRVVNRDDPTKDWDSNVLEQGIVPVYAGQVSGDMVSWKPGWPVSQAMISSTTFSWSVKDTNGNSITDENGNAVTGPSGLGVSEWRIADGGNDPHSEWLNWRPGIYNITCTFTPQGGTQSSFTFQQEVGQRTKDVVVIGWINRDAVPLPTAGVHSEIYQWDFLPDGSDDPSEVLPDLAFFVLGLTPAYMNTADKTYVLDWLFKYGGNLSAPPNTFPDEATLEAFVKDRTKYKLFNRLQIKYRVDGSQFGSVPVPTILGTTDKTVVGTTIDPVTSQPHQGQAGPVDGLQFITGNSIYHQINEGTPSSSGLAVINTLMSPNKWNDIGSKIDMGVPLDSGNPPITGYTVEYQVYPTFYIYERSTDDGFYLMKVIPQAETPAAGFSLTPSEPFLFGP